MVAEDRAVQAIDAEDRQREPLQPAMYSLRQLAELLGESYPATWGSFSAGKLPWEPIRIGRKIYFRRREVDQTLGIDGQAVGGRRE